MCSSTELGMVAGTTAGSYLATEWAMPARSRSSSGGRHRAVFSTLNAARMPASLIPRRLIDPAIEARRVFLWPAAMVSGTGAASGAVVRRRPPLEELLRVATASTSHFGGRLGGISHGAQPSYHSQVPAPLWLGQTTT